MRKYLAATLALALVLLGCTSDDDDTSAGGDTTSSTDAEETTETTEPSGDPGPGVTADAIRIGITYVDLEAIKDIVDIDHGDYEASYQALIDDLNERGGINGRMVEAVFAPINPIGTQPAEEACVKLTRDEELFLAMGFFLDDGVLCFVETNEMAVIGGTMTEERLTRAQAPWFTTETGSDFQADGIRTLAEAGELDGQLGVFTRVADESLLRNTVEPLLEELGIEPVEVAVHDAPPEDIAAANAQVGVIAERFRSAGVEKVLVVGQGGTGWGTGMEGNSYQPQPIFVGFSEVQAYAMDQAGRDLSFLEGSVAAAQYPNELWYESDEAREACIDVMTAAGVEIVDPVENPDVNGVTAARTACQTMKLFEAIATDAGDVLNYDTFEAAGNDLGSFEMPGNPQRWTFGPPPSADGDPPLYLFDWVPADSRFVIRES